MLRTVASKAILIINRKSRKCWRCFVKDSDALGSSNGLPMHVRTVFSSSGIGLENFKLAREQYLSRNAPSIGKYNEFDRLVLIDLVDLDGFKKRFLESVQQSDSQIFTEDLKNMIMSADSDEEINGVIQALKK